MEQHPATTNSSHNFVLNLQVLATETVLEMRVPKENISTQSFASTTKILKKRAPSVLKTTCFNPLDIPFKEEVKCTQTAHLFEHLLIDFMCDEKLRLGCGEACFRGVTRWNWKKDPIGVFHITIHSDQGDESILHLALNKTIQIMEEIFASASSITTQESLATPLHATHLAH